MLGTTPNGVLTSHAMSSHPSYFFSRAATAEPTVIRSCSFGATLTERESDLGNPVVQGLRIFRTGTFTDFFGNEATWEDHHLDLMVAHFTLLRDSGALPHIPVRIDHGWSMEDVIGYLDSVYRDPEDPQFLAGDIEFTEPEAYERYKRGTYRNRSIEIGPYETNAGATYFPVVRGLAFVDLPAVEGLHSKNKKDGLTSFHVMTDKKEESSVDMNDPGWPAAAAYAQWVKDAEYAQWEVDAKYAQWVVDATYAQALVDQAVVTNTTNGTQNTTSHAALQQVGYNFRIGNETTQDFARVQAHIDGLTQEVTVLRQFRDETQNSVRTEFVAGLADSGAIAAPMAESLTALALTMTPEQFEAFRATYALAPSASLFGRYGDTQPAAPAAGDPQAQELDTNVEVLRNFRRAGQDVEWIKKTKAYAAVAAVNPGLAEQALTAI